MKIGIDARFLTHPQVGGFKTYSENLVSALAQIDSTNDYIIYIDRRSNTFELPENDSFVFKVVDGTLPGIGMPFREQIGLRREINKDRPDVVHHLCNTAPINPYSKSILTLHDTIQINNNYHFRLFADNGQKKQWIMALYSKWTIMRSIKDISRIITVSHYEKKKICDQLNVDPASVCVSHLAPKDIFSPVQRDSIGDVHSAKSKELALPKNFILGVGYESRKNIPLLMKAFSKIAGLHPNLELVIVAAEVNSRQRFQELALKFGSSERMHFLPAQNSTNLSILYNLAELFVYPSERESFGLPPLEAIACGTPTIAMNVASIPEILQDGAMLINGKSVDTWADAIHKVLGDEELRTKLVNQGLEQAAKFSWKACAQTTLQIYNSVAEGK